MRLSHIPARTSAVFDDPNLVSHGGLVPVMALAERAGLPELLAEHVRPGGGCGVNAPLKVGCLVAGMAAGADSVDDMGLLRHGAMDVLFGGVRAPSTLGSHLRSYTWGNVLQLEKAGRELLARLARQAPLLPGADVLAFIDIDSTQKRVYGHKKEGARFGHTKIQGKSVLVRGLNALIAAVSTPLAAPVAAATRLRGGNAPSARGAASLAAQAVRTARACGCTGTILVRMDCAYYAAAVIAAIRRNGARFSVTAPASAAIRAAIAAIPQDAWQAIAYPPKTRPAIVTMLVTIYSNEFSKNAVELRGFEPLTFCMPCRRATSCAIAPQPTDVTPVDGRPAMWNVVSIQGPRACVVLDRHAITTASPPRPLRRRHRKP